MNPIRDYLPMNRRLIASISNSRFLRAYSSVHCSDPKSEIVWCTNPLCCDLHSQGKESYCIAWTKRTPIQCRYGICTVRDCYIQRNKFVIPNYCQKLNQQNFRDKVLLTSAIIVLSPIWISTGVLMAGSMMFWL